MLSQMRANAKYIWIFAAVAFVGGFLLYQTSGLAGQSRNTASSVVASVNGRDVTISTWLAATQRQEQDAQQRLGRSLTLDERKELEQQTFDQMVSDILLQQEFERRGISVSDNEIQQAAEENPPPAFLQAPELQTDGHFDPAKYERYLSSPMARQSGLLLQLEQMYRDQIPREKLFEQVATAVYVTDAQLWSYWRDTHDSASISYVSWRPADLPDSAIHVSDGDVKAYYNSHKKELTRKGRATLALVALPHLVTAADTAATRTHLLALREEIEKGAKFEDVAKRESQDSASAVNGGSLGTVTRGRFVPQFDSAAFKLKVGELSQPVQSPYGFHLIKVDARKGDSITVRHILLKVQQSDSAAARTNRMADSLEKIAGQSVVPAQFDKAARLLGLPVSRIRVTEDEPVIWNGRQVPSVGTWAFSGVKVGESSELFDAEDAYYLARVDSLEPGGLPSLDDAKPSIRRILGRKAAIETLRPAAQAFAAAAAGSSLDAQAKAAGLSVRTTAMFAPIAFVPDIGRMNEVVGAAFSLPPSTISAPIATTEAMYVIRVERRVAADKTVWAAQKEQQRQGLLQQLRQQAVRAYLDEIRDAAKITDNRKEIEAANRHASNA